jgi:hypothetical protein
MTGLYDREHETVRQAFLASYQPDDPCWRCGQPLGIDPGALDLGHDDDNPARYRGLEHARCNRAAGGAKGHARRKARRERANRLVEEAAIGIEVSEDRRHCSIVTAGRLQDDLVLLRLAGYLDSTDPVGAVLELQQQLLVVAVVVDPHAPGATTIRPLEDAGVDVLKPTSSDVAVSHGLFLDSLAGGRIRHQGQQELTAGMRALEARRLGGASAPERRGATADVSPAVAAELATWAILTAPAPYDPSDSVR